MHLHVLPVFISHLNLHFLNPLYSFSLLLIKLFQSLLQILPFTLFHNAFYSLACILFILRLQKFLRIANLLVSSLQICLSLHFILQFELMSSDSFPFIDIACFEVSGVVSHLIFFRRDRSLVIFLHTERAYSQWVVD